jgi:hypothetical protein
MMAELVVRPVQEMENARGLGERVVRDVPIG